MNVFSVLAIAIVASLMLPNMTALATDLSPYRWKQRLLLVFAPTPATSAYQALDRQLKQHPAGVAERDLMVFHLFGEGSSHGPDGAVAPEDAEVLRRQFGLAGDDFRMLLIGKDGGTKGSYGSPPDLMAIFDRIDAMPMRREEMRRSGQGQ